MDEKKKTFNSALNLSCRLIAGVGLVEEKER